MTSHPVLHAMLNTFKFLRIYEKQNMQCFWRWIWIISTRETFFENFLFNKYQVCCLNCEINSIFNVKSLNIVFLYSMSIITKKFHVILFHSFREVALTNKKNQDWRPDWQRNERMLKIFYPPQLVACGIINWWLKK